MGRHGQRYVSDEQLVNTSIIIIKIRPRRPSAEHQRDDDGECGGYAAHENLIDDKQFGAAFGHRAVCPCIVGHLVALAGLERYRAAVLEFRDQLTVEDQ